MTPFEEARDTLRRRLNDNGPHVRLYSDLELDTVMARFLRWNVLAVAREAIYSAKSLLCKTCHGTHVVGPGLLTQTPCPDCMPKKGTP